MTIYIVSGFMRSGTSMMMKALEAGGLEAVYNPSRDEMNTIHGDEDYKINEGGFYELTRAEYTHPGFPDNYDGKLVKCLWGGMVWLRGSSILKRIIFMRRPIAEIAASYEAAFDYQHPAAIPELADRLDRIQGILSQRKDVALTVIHYRDVLDNPNRIFSGLHTDGWPINVMNAASVVKPQLYRHRA